MALRILHSSDWHLGAMLETVPRDEEHVRLLEWMLNISRTEDIDVLVLAGDVFQYSQPSSEAQRLYYRFLARVGVETKVRQVVVVGGNHDSASRLEAPREVLEVLNVHLVGGLSSEPEEWERCLCPIRDSSGAVEAVVVAVPFVHEFRLGVRTTGLSSAELALEMKTAFTRLYRDLASLAEGRFPGVPLLATGHLTCLGTQADELGTEIHQVGTIAGLPGDIFDPRFEYIALGHIHRSFPIEGSRAYYSGSPLPMNIGEARTRRKVLKLDLDGSRPPGSRVQVRALEVPVFREILELRGPLENVLEKLSLLESPAELPPLVYLDVEVDTYHTDVGERVHRVLSRFPEGGRPHIVQVRQHVTHPAGLEEDPGQPYGLRDLRPEEVFLRLYRARRQCEPSEATLLAFRSLLADRSA